jgi:hypothetical protein
VVDGGACVPAWQPNMPAKAKPAVVKETNFIDALTKPYAPKWGRAKRYRDGFHRGGTEN